MASKKSTNISLMILGAASLIGIGYFIWLFLAPPPAIETVEKVVITDLDTTLVKSSGFQALQEFVRLPIKAGTVGRIDPFSDFAPAAPAENGNVNSPPKNSPENITPNGNSQ